MKTETQTAARTGQAAHTPTPWRVGKTSPLFVWGADDSKVAETVPEENYGKARSHAAANAAFIVRACNSHDALIAALQLVVKHADFSQCPLDVEAAVDAALAQAGAIEIP